MPVNKHTCCCTTRSHRLAGRRDRLAIGMASDDRVTLLDRTNVCVCDDTHSTHTTVFCGVAGLWVFEWGSWWWAHTYTCTHNSTATVEANSNGLLTTPFFKDRYPGWPSFVPRLLPPDPVSIYSNCASLPTQTESDWLLLKRRLSPPSATLNNTQNYSKRAICTYNNGQNALT